MRKFAENPFVERFSFFSGQRREKAVSQQIFAEKIRICYTFPEIKAYALDCLPYYISLVLYYSHRTPDRYGGATTVCLGEYGI